MATTHTQEPLVYEPMKLPPRRKISTRAAIHWLSEGRRYLSQATGTAIAYGGVFAAIGMLITWLGFSEPQFVFTFWSGFLLVGPLLAMGLYRIAQLIDRGETIQLSTCWRVMRQRLGSVALFGLLLAVVMIAWIRVSSLIAALYVGSIAGTSSFITMMGTPEGVGFLFTLFGVGAVFAVIMFAMTAWSLPMVLDAKADFGPAIAASVKAVVEQPIPMLMWGAIVAGLTIIGMLTAFAAFIVIFPLLGFATWAGYKDIFGRD